MPLFDQESFNQFIAENDVYGFFEDAITLKSGRKSHFYANWRNVAEDAWLMAELVRYLLAFVEDNQIKVDTFYGVPEGATKLGILAQFEWAKQQKGFARGSHVLSMGRARPKEHGAAKDRFFVGQPRGKVVVLEDVTTTGGSSLATIQNLRNTGIEVAALISLTNRMEIRDDGRSVEEAIRSSNLAFYSMSSAIDLIPRMYARLQPGEVIGRAIEAEFQEFGIAPVKLM